MAMISIGSGVVNVEADGRKSNGEDSGEEAKSVRGRNLIPPSDAIADYVIVVFTPSTLVNANVATHTMSVLPNATTTYVRLLHSLNSLTPSPALPSASLNSSDILTSSSLAQNPRITPLDSQSGHEALLTAWHALHIIGGQILLPFLLVTIFYSGKTNDANPPIQLCLIQASLVLGSEGMTVITSLSVVIQAWYYLRVSSVPDAEPRIYGWQTTLLILTSYIALIGYATASAISGVVDPSLVGRSYNIFVSDIRHRHLATALALLALLAGLLIILLSTHILYLIYSNRHTIKHWRLSKSESDIGMIFRTLVFVGYGVACVVVSALAAFTARTDFVYMFTAALPTISFFVFGTRSGTTRLWRKWLGLRVPPVAPTIHPPGAGVPGAGAPGAGGPMELDEFSKVDADAEGDVDVDVEEVRNDRNDKRDGRDGRDGRRGVRITRRTSVYTTSPSGETTRLHLQRAPSSHSPTSPTSPKRPGILPHPLSSPTPRSQSGSLTGSPLSPRSPTSQTKAKGFSSSSTYLYPRSGSHRRVRESGSGASIYPTPPPSSSHSPANISSSNSGLAPGAGSGLGGGLGGGLGMRNTLSSSGIPKIYTPGENPSTTPLSQTNTQTILRDGKESGDGDGGKIGSRGVMRSASTPRWSGQVKQGSAESDASRRAVFSQFGSHSGTHSLEDYWEDDDEEGLSSGEDGEDHEKEGLYAGMAETMSPDEFTELTELGHDRHLHYDFRGDEGEEEDEDASFASEREMEKKRAEKGKWRATPSDESTSHDHDASGRKTKSEPVSHTPPPPPPSYPSHPHPQSYTSTRARPQGPRQRRSQRQRQMHIPLPPPPPSVSLMRNMMAHRHTGYSTSTSVDTETPPTAGTTGHSPHSHSNSFGYERTGSYPYRSDIRSPDLLSTQAEGSHHSHSHSHHDTPLEPNEREEDEYQAVNGGSADITPVREQNSWLSSLARTLSLSTSSNTHAHSHPHRPINSRNLSRTSRANALERSVGASVGRRGAEKRVKRPAMVEWTSEPWLPIAAKFSSGSMDGPY
ncbi:hypothetical protein SISNIDRAFT_552007 [Sistotremastrum niveocremeum HHB9708]|uniref:Uncharacterized protein n=1 Tax=Sistotremastrum niveocremeum HHB9708 TaxID=1314777 RepID=A0A164QGJ6_9AGAM|nr:hypothetical protein SISNIDRAFT_552007 [Sistotremastrum niveocremeum HHB9708]